ncbi:MAG TPA: phosphatase PAP2 family protein [Paracoccaceae bacterium]|nr:phosphatase PAP2 family protein [Paracoccaceae bacterium]
MAALPFPDDATAEAVAPVAGGGTVARLVRPVFDQAFLDDQLPILRSYADLRLDRMAEIMVQAGDIVSFFGAQAYLDRVATKRSLELIWALLRLVGRLEMRVKMHMDFPRPITASPDLQPPVQTPGHGAWPSGHATEAFAVAALFSALQSGGAFDAAAAVTARSLPMRLAARIAQNRTIAGMHYPSDSMAGAMLGLGIAECLVNWLSGQPDTPLRRFDGTAWRGDFDLSTLEVELAATGVRSAITAAPPPVLASMWQIARDEWA